MRIGSGVQSVSELFGKRQNNSKTSVNGNEAFPQTSMKVSRGIQVDHWIT